MKAKPPRWIVFLMHEYDDGWSNNVLSYRITICARKVTVAGHRGKKKTNKQTKKKKKTEQNKTKNKQTHHQTNKHTPQHFSHCTLDNAHLFARYWSSLYYLYAWIIFYLTEFRFVFVSHFFNPVFTFDQNSWRKFNENIFQCQRFATDIWPTLITLHILCVNQ